LSGSFTFFNKSLCIILGHSEDELMGMNYRAYTNDDRSETVYQAFNNVYRTKKPTKIFDWEVIRKDGTRRLVETSISLMVDSAGEPFGFRGIVRDITERKRAERAVQRSEERFRTIFEESPIGIDVFDSDGILIEGNKACLDVFGVSSVDDLRGFRLFDDPNIPEKMKRKLRDGETVRYQAPFDFGKVKERGSYETTRSGIAYFSTSITPFGLGEEGAFGGYIVQMQDVTERKIVEEALRASQQLVKRTFDSLSEAVLVIEISTTEIMDCNPVAETVFGYRRQELLGKKISMLHVDEATYKEFKENLYPAIEEKGRLDRFEFRMKRRDGTVFPTEHSVTPLKNEQGKRIGWVSVIRDITESKQNEEQRRQQHSELEVYASLLRHDLRNDVGVILGNVDLAKMIAGENESEIIETLSSTEAVCNRMMNLLKAVSRPSDSIEKNIVALVRTVSSQAQGAHAILTVNVTVDDDAEALAIGSNRLLPMVFENLLRNAAAHAGEKPIVDIIVSKEGSNVQVLVSDNGPGVPEEVRNRLFHRGVSTSGGGLGLYLSKSIVNAMNGSIELMDTDPGVGATFKILLPLTV
ncbi:MAG: PAS domain S-box protein, partial [Candidatus Thorarchaeota archaeon]